MAENRQAFRPRGPGLAFTALATVAVLLLGLVSLNASQTPPPTVAEFAPSALSQIRHAPKGQGSDVGNGAPGGTGNRGGAPSARPTPPGPPPPAVNDKIPAQFLCVGN